MSKTDIQSAPREENNNNENDVVDETGNRRYTSSEDQPVARMPDRYDDGRRLQRLQYVGKINKKEDAADRQSFIIRVFFYLMCMLVGSFGLGVATHFAVLPFYEVQRWECVAIFLVSAIGVLIQGFVAMKFPLRLRDAPRHLVLHTLFTSAMVGSIHVRFPTDTLISLMEITGLVVSILSLAVFVPIDFTRWSKMFLQMFCFLFIITFFLLLSQNDTMLWINQLVSYPTALLACLHLICTFQNIGGTPKCGGKPRKYTYSLDDAIFATFILYVEVVNCFFAIENMNGHCILLFLIIYLRPLESAGGNLPF